MGNLFQYHATANVDIEIEFCHIEIESYLLDFVLLQELIRDFAFLFFLPFLLFQI